MSATTREHAVNAEKMLNYSLHDTLTDIQLKIAYENAVTCEDLRIMTVVTDRLFVPTERLPRI